MRIINGYALVEVTDKGNKLKSGLYVSTDDVVNDEGVVLGVDDDVSHIVGIGDRVKFNPNMGHDFEYHGKRCKFLLVYDKNSPRTDIVLKYGE